MTRLVLASGSPRRRELLEQFEIDFDVVSADIDETPLPGERPDVLVHRLSKAKTWSGSSHADRDVVVIGADTVVVLDDEILGKPVDEDDARRMLRSLSGRTHEVITGVTVRVGTHFHGLTERTAVTFAELSDDDIEWYIGTGEPLDKAGAYAIQGLGGVFVTRIEGSVSNVIGLPLHLARTLLAEHGIDLVR